MTTFLFVTQLIAFIIVMYCSVKIFQLNRLTEENVERAQDNAQKAKKKSEELQLKLKEMFEEDKKNLIVLEKMNQNFLMFEQEYGVVDPHHGPIVEDLPDDDEGNTRWH